MLQLQHLDSGNQRPLPLLVSYAGPKARTHAALEQLVARKAIFWGNGPEVFRQAKVADGLVSTWAASPSEVAQLSSDRSPQDCLEMIKQATNPWQHAVLERLYHADHETLTELMKYMDFTLDEIRDLWRIVPQQLRERFLRIQPFRVALNRVRIGDHDVVERTSGWLLGKTGEQICDSPIRIDEIIRASDGRIYERGVVVLDGQSTSFCVVRDDIRRDGLFAAISEHLIQTGHRPLIYQRRWRKVAAQISYQFHRTTVVRDADRIGWNEDYRGFLFSRFAVMQGGRLDKDIRALLLDEPVPAANLQPSENLPDGAAEVLSSRLPEVAITWALAACVVHNLLAWPLSYDPVGVLLDGAGAQAAGQVVAEALGCIQIDARNRQYAAKPIEWLGRACNKHGWPSRLCLTRGSRPKLNWEWAVSRGPRNAILALDWLHSQMLAMHGSYHMIRGDEAKRLSEPLRTAAAGLIVPYLFDLCQRGLGVDPAGESRLERILNDMATWFSKQGGDRSAVSAARQCLVPADSRPAWEYLVEIIGGLSGAVSSYNGEARCRRSLRRRTGRR